MVIAVVIPSYKVKKQIAQVIAGIGPEVSLVYVVDDCCPEGTGKFVEAVCRDERVHLLYHDRNQGVGGATMTGYRQAIRDGADVIIKLDGDGQMDPSLIPLFIKPIVQGEADYTKGNRFYYLEDLPQMPFARLVGNSVLSFITKFSSGYWNIFDPTNGYTAIHAGVAEKLPWDKLDRRYFFESDMLFRLNTLGAVVMDIPMTARYGSEESSLNILGAIPNFLVKHFRNSIKRIFYNYYLRDFSLASLEILLGLFSLLFGVVFGAMSWAASVKSGMTASSGTVMLSALPTLIGIQLLLAFLSVDIGNLPRVPLQKRM